MRCTIRVNELVAALEQLKGEYKIQLETITFSVSALRLTSISVLFPIIDLRADKGKPLSEGKVKVTVAELLKAAKILQESGVTGASLETDADYDNAPKGTIRITDTKLLGPIAYVLYSID